MTEPGLPVPIEEQEDTFLRNIHRLFFRPKVYFEGITAPKKKGWLFVFALSYALAGTIAGDRGPETWGWAPHWGGIILGGIIGMVLAYYLGGAWYAFRLGVCGVPNKDKKLIRLVYLSSAQVSAIPVIVLEIILTVRFPDPTAAAAGVPFWLLVLLGSVFALWAYYTSYIGVRTVFKVPRLRAAIWFFVLPVLFLILLGIVMLVYIAPYVGLELSPRAPIPRAEISEPSSFSDLGMAFSYPSNWSVTESGRSTEVKAKVEIQGHAGSYLLIQRVETKDRAEVVADNWFASMSESLSPGATPKPFYAWGTLEGAGRRFEMRSGEDLYEVRFLVAPIAKGQVLMIYETSPKAAGSRLERGFKLIRKTFRITD